MVCFNWRVCPPRQIKAIVQSGIDVPGNENEIKKMQLMQLAELNGTFKPIDVLRWAWLGLGGCGYIYRAEYMYIQ